MGRSALSIFILVLLVVALPDAPAEARNANTPATRAQIAVLPASQAQALRQSQIRVRVRSNGRTRIRFGGGFVRHRAIRLGGRAGLVRTVPLRLTRNGTRVLQRCGRQSVRVTGVYHRLVRRKGVFRLAAGRTAARRTLTPDPARCETPEPPRPPIPEPDPRPACDPLDPALCLSPFPNNYFTRVDPDSRTGLRLDLDEEMMPANRAGKHIDPAPWNTSDGFSPGSLIFVKVPGLDNPEALAQTDPVSIASIGDYAKPDAPVVLIEAETGERVPIWVELDSTSEEDSDRVLQIQPAANLKPETRYVVALRDLKRADGSLIEPGPTFRAYRDGEGVKGDPDGSRRMTMAQNFNDLAAAGIARDDLYLAWDFTVASDESLTERLLSIRDRAFSDLDDENLADRDITGTRAPEFEVTGVSEFTVGQNPRIARHIRGTVKVPCFLWPDCEMVTGPEVAGSYRLGADGLPVENTDSPIDAPFTCIVPRAAATSPARPSLYGHGLFSSRDEVTIRPHENLAQNHNMVLCATDGTSLTTAELGHVISIIQDFSRFPEISDGMQQGMLNALYLGRAMIHEDGFSSHPDFRTNRASDGDPVIDVSRPLSYSGYSMGGIMGAMLTAVSPDVNRAVLGVPGMRFSLMLPRSSYWVQFGGLIKGAYPDDLETPLVLSLLQTIWDRGEASGYAGRITSDPLPNTPGGKAVLLNTAFGDHQVSVWATDVLARTVGASARTPILDPGRWAGVDELWGIPRIGDWPHTGSAMVMWDIGPVREGAEGVPAPPITNTPNLGGDDPHDMIWNMAAERAAVSDFLDYDYEDDGETLSVDPCPAGTPCYAGTWTGP